MCSRDLFKIGDKIKYVDDDGNHFYGTVESPCVQVHEHAVNLAVVVQVNWDADHSVSLRRYANFFPSRFKCQDQLERPVTGELETIEVMEL